MFQCKLCLNSFKTKESLIRHEKTSKMCKKYKNILFTCLNCNFNTRGVKCIHKHIEECKSQKVVKTKEEKLQEEVNNLKKKFQFESFKNKIFLHLIQENTNINIKDILYDSNEELNFNRAPENLKIFLTNIEPEENININFESKSNNKSTLKNTKYKKIKSRLKLVEEHKISSDTEIVLKTSSNKIDIDKNIETLLDSLKNVRNYTKVLKQIYKQRIKYLNIMGIEDYKKFLFKHIDNIKIIFEEKKYDEKKIINIISKNLSPLETRITLYKGYMNKFIETDEIEKLRFSIKLNKKFPTEFKPLNKTKILSIFYNYYLVLFPIKVLIEEGMFVYSKFPNIIYLPLKKSKKEDPYSFYTLAKIENNIRCWEMDCRAENLSIFISENILEFAINTFRKIYKDIFGDNNFRKDYYLNCQITEYDLEQLLENIFIIANPKNFCNLMRSIIVKKAEYYKQENDYVNLSGDDSLQRKRFKKEENIDLVDIIKRLFDGITSEDAVDFYRRKKQ